jgi:hypothetical protein
MSNDMQCADDQEAYSPAWLNSLSDEDKRAVLAGQFGRRMQQSYGEPVRP